MKKLLITATLAALTLTAPTTVSAKANVRYSSGIITGSKTITTSDGNIWRTRRKLHLHKGTNVQVKFDTKGTKRKKDDSIIKVSNVQKKQVKPEISIPVSDIALVYTDSLGYTTLQLNPDCTVWDRMINPMIGTDLDYIHTAHIDNMITELEV